MAAAVVEARKAPEADSVAETSGAPDPVAVAVLAAEATAVEEAGVVVVVVVMVAAATVAATMAAATRTEEVAVPGKRPPEEGMR